MSGNPGSPPAAAALPEGGDPLDLLQGWLAEAKDSPQPLPEAACLATATAAGAPSARMVLVKGVDARGLVFYTNRESRKGRELAENPRAALCIHWVHLGRQVRVEGAVEPVAAKESDGYFATRPRGSQTGAWASPQSEPLGGGLEDLRRRLAGVEERFASGEVPRPPHWIGYRVALERVEFWVHRDDRLHERLMFERSGSAWTVTRLAP